MNRILDKLMYTPEFEVVRKPYDKAKGIFTKVDVELGFVIDRFRRKLFSKQRIGVVERNVEEKINALDEISRTLPLEEEEDRLLKDKKGQLQWTLNQIRGAK